MTEKTQFTKNSNFYKDFRETNPGLVFGLILISLGFYIINWLYMKNKEFELIDSEAPDSNRGAIIMMIFPFAWFFILFILKTLIFEKSNLYLNLIGILGWIVVIFLIMKYLFDFCISFGKITKTNGIYWYLFFILPAVGVILAFFGYYYFLFLLFFLLVVIPAMQAELNSFFQKFHIKKENNIFYN